MFTGPFIYVGTPPPTNHQGGGCVHNGIRQLPRALEHCGCRVRGVVNPSAGAGAFVVSSAGLLVVAGDNTGMAGAWVLALPISFLTALILKHLCADWT